MSRTVYEYDSTGNLRRVVDSKGIDPGDGTPLYGDDGSGAATGDQARHATVYATDSDNLLTDRFLPWGYYDTRDERRYRQHFERDARGRVDSIDAPYDPDHDSASDKEDGARTGYSFYSNGWIASAQDQRYTGNGRTGLDTVRTFHYDYDRQGNQTDWRLGEPDSHRYVWREYYPDGSLGRRIAYENGSDPGRRYSYASYGDGRTSQLKDGNLGRTTDLVYDSAHGSSTSTRNGSSTATPSIATTRTAMSNSAGPTASWILSTTTTTAESRRSSNTTQSAGSARHSSSAVESPIARR